MTDDWELLTEGRRPADTPEEVTHPADVPCVRFGEVTLRELADFAFGRAPEGAASRVESHIRECPYCDGVVGVYRFAVRTDAAGGAHGVGGAGRSAGGPTGKESSGMAEDATARSKAGAGTAPPLQEWLIAEIQGRLHPDEVSNRSLADGLWGDLAGSDQWAAGHSPGDFFVAAAKAIREMLRHEATTRSPAAPPGPSESATIPTSDGATQSVNTSGPLPAPDNPTGEGATRSLESSSPIPAPDPAVILTLTGSRSWPSDFKRLDDIISDGQEESPEAANILLLGFYAGRFPAEISRFLAVPVSDVHDVLVTTHTNCELAPRGG